VPDNHSAIISASWFKYHRERSKVSAILPGPDREFAYQQGDG
jgi:hypothetical protein